MKKITDVETLRSLEELNSLGVKFLRLNAYGGDDQSYFDVEYPGVKWEVVRDLPSGHDWYSLAEDMLDYIPNAGAGYLFGWHILVNTETKEAVVEDRWEDTKITKPVDMVPKAWGTIPNDW